MAHWLVIQREMWPELSSIGATVRSHHTYQRRRAAGPKPKRANADQKTRHFLAVVPSLINQTTEPSSSWNGWFDRSTWAIGSVNRAGTVETRNSTSLRSLPTGSALQSIIWCLQMAETWIISPSNRRRERKQSRWLDPSNLNSSDIIRLMNMIIVSNHSADIPRIFRGYSVDIPWIFLAACPDVTTDVGYLERSHRLRSASLRKEKEEKKKFWCWFDSTYKDIWLYIFARINLPDLNIWAHRLLVVSSPAHLVYGGEGDLFWFLHTRACVCVCVWYLLRLTR